MKQKAQITFERLEKVVLKKSSMHMTSYCPICRADVELVTAEILAALAGTTEREVFRLLETEMIHFVEMTRIYACPGCYERMLKETGSSDKRMALKGEVR